MGPGNQLSAELAGKPWPKSPRRMKLILKDDNYTVQIGDQKDEGTVKRDPSKSPKTMDISGKKAPTRGRPFSPSTS